MDGTLYGYQRNSWGPGDELYVRDFNASISRKLNKRWKAKYTFYHFDVNTQTTPVTTDYKGSVNANIHVLETQWKVKPKQSLRTEIQGLWVGEDKDNPDLLQDKATGPRCSWNTPGRPTGLSACWTNTTLATTTRPAHPLRLRCGGLHQWTPQAERGYGKRREGIFCIGGVCRAVPASNGFEVTFTSSF